MILKTVKQIHQEMIKNGEAILELEDVAVVDIEDGSYFSSGGGCPTCNYGEEFISEFTLKFSDESKMLFAWGSSYEFPLSYSDFILFLVNNIDEFKKMSKKEFCDYLNCIENIVGRRE